MVSKATTILILEHQRMKVQNKFYRKENAQYKIKILLIIFVLKKVREFVLRVLEKF
jgi:hypothetical protein